MQALFTWLNQPLIDRVGWTLLHSTWLVALVAVVVAGELLVLRRKSAAARYFVSVTGLAIIAIVPVGVFLCVHVDSPPAGPVVDGAGLAIDSGATEIPRVDLTPNVAYESGDTTTPLNTTAMAARLRPLLPWSVTVWAGGVLMLSARLLIMWLLIQRLRFAGTTPVTATAHAALQRVCDRMRFRRPVELLQSAIVQAPTAIGCLRPLILLPASSLTGLDVRELEAILAHELAHIRRHDYLVNVLQSVVEILLFFHPAVWWLSRRIRIERENCCDDVAVGVVGNQLDYARALARVAELSCRPAGLAAAANGGDLFARIRRLLSEPSDHVSPGSRWTSGSITLVMVGALVLGLSISSQKSSAVADEKPDPKATKQAAERDDIPADDKPAAKIDKVADADAAAEYEKLCALPEYTALKRIAPPFPASRLAYYRTKHPGQANAIPKGPDNMFFRWKEGELSNWGMSFSDGNGIDLGTAIRMLMNVYPQEIVDDHDLRKLRITGDFVVNVDGSRPRIIARLEKLFNDQSKQKISMKFREVEREVYVARGTYELKPLNPDNPQVEIYGEKLNSNPRIGGGGSGDLKNFLDWVGMWIAEPVVSETETLPKVQLRWHYNRGDAKTAEERRRAKDPELVLKHVTEQTGLTFKKEKRKVRALVLERAK